MEDAIVITGATGNVGSALAAEFLLRRHRVVCLSRNDDDGARGKISIAIVDEPA